MSDEESFVILGSSPMSSLEVDGYDEPRNTLSSTLLESDTPGSRFNSLKKSQLNDLENAQASSTPEPTLDETQMQSNKIQNGNSQDKLNDSLKNSADLQMETQTSSAEVNKNSMKNRETVIKPTAVNAESKLWSRSPQEHKYKDDEELSLSLEDCAINSLLNSKKQQQKEDLKAPQNISSTSNQTVVEEKTFNASNGHHSETSVTTNNSLASSFIMGEINADVLKTSVYSQFPSISMHSSAEEILKLQNMVTENMQLKVILEKVNSTMRFFHSSSLQWQEKMNNMETKYKKELEDCQKEIEMLRKENQILQDNLKTQIEAIEIARQKDREETIKEISEKNSLVENMRAEIVKLEKQQLASFEFLGQNDKTKSDFRKLYIPREEHDMKIKVLERNLSELYASNLDYKDIEKHYIDELNCLKVNLTAAEELIIANRATITQLNAHVVQQLDKIKQLEKTIDDLRLTSVEQNERILVLEQQNDVYRKDFEMEQEGRNMVVKEKQHILQDLKTLQKRNQELIEEHQKLVDNYEKRLLSSQKSVMNQSFVSAAPAAQTYFNNPQRPIRDLPSTSSASNTPNDSLNSCPICNKAFKSLSILQSHVNDCIDKN